MRSAISGGPAPLLLVAALLACGCGSFREDREQAGREAKPDPAPWFEEVAARRGIDFVFESGHRERYYMPESMAGGGALFDMDGDGDLDAYLVQGGRLDALPRERPGNRIFRNLGGGRFADVTAGSGSDDRGYGMGVATGDYDNDGDMDLYVTNVGANVLLQNQGGGRFADVTAAAAVGDTAWGASAMFLDYDADGDLDLFATNYVTWSIRRDKVCLGPLGAPTYCPPGRSRWSNPTPDVLYRNNGDGSFSDVSAESGIAAAKGNGLGVVSGDFDNDGDSDIFVANDGTVNHLWLNQGDGSFVEDAMLRGCARDESGQVKAGMGVAAEDVDGDLNFDLLVVNLRQQTDSFYRNRGTFFSDETAAAGLVLDSFALTRFGVGFTDFDNDGLLDLYIANGRIDNSNKVLFSSDIFAEPNLLLRGRPGLRFRKVEPMGGTRELLVGTSRAAAFGDVDDDGGVDVLVVNRDGPAYLLRNAVSGKGAWIAFDVLDARSSPSLGARLTFKVGEKKMIREVRTAYSYLAASDPRVHVGLGGAGGVSEVEVRWPGGQRESFGDFDAGQRVVLRRGHGLTAPAGAAGAKAGRSHF